MHSIRKLLPHLSKDLSLEYEFSPATLSWISGGRGDISWSVFSGMVLHPLITVTPGDRNVKFGAHVPSTSVLMALFWLLVAYSLWLLRRLWASKIPGFHWCMEGKRIWSCQDPGPACCNCIIFLIVWSWMDDLSNSITHDYFLLLPCKLDKTLISTHTAVGRGLSFSAPYTVLGENFHVSKNTRLVLFV